MSSLKRLLKKSQVHCYKVYGALFDVGHCFIKLAFGVVLEMYYFL